MVRHLRPQMQGSPFLRHDEDMMEAEYKQKVVKTLAGDKPNEKPHKRDDIDPREKDEKLSWKLGDKSSLDAMSGKGALPRKDDFGFKNMKGSGFKKSGLTRALDSGMSKASFRRLARRGGVRRISGLMYQEGRRSLRGFLNQTINDTIALTLLNRRQTVKAVDVIRALQRMGKSMYGSSY